MNKLIVVSLLAATVGIASADPKAKTPPPPVPKYWIGTFTLDDDARGEPGKVQDGTVKVKAADAPKNAILVQPLDAKRVATPDVGLGDDDKLYRGHYLTPDGEMGVWTPAMVLVVDQATCPKPALIKTAKVKKAVLKFAVKETEDKQVAKWAVGLADLDADGIADVALVYGVGKGPDGVPFDYQTLVYERDGKGWKGIFTESE